MTASDIEQLEDGRWVPATPLPWYGLFWYRCQCGRRFFTMARYRVHWRARHGNEP